MYAALGAALVLVGWMGGRLVTRSEEVARAKLHRGLALAWISPWLLYMQWINPLAWRWGSVLAVGMPFAWERARWKHARRDRLTWMSWIGFVWLLQQTPFLKLLGVAHWTDLHPYGLVSFYWFLLLGLA